MATEVKVPTLGESITEATLDNGAHLTAALCHLYGLGRPQWLKNVFPHNHFAATSCPGQSRWRWSLKLALRRMTPVDGSTVLSMKTRVPRRGSASPSVSPASTLRVPPAR